MGWDAEEAADAVASATPEEIAKAESEGRQYELDRIRDAIEAGEDPAEVLEEYDA